MVEDSMGFQSSPFDAIRQIDGQGMERWSARELYKILGYTEWRNFHNIVLKRAQKACEQNGQAVSDHFVRSYTMIARGKGAKKQAEDILLSRYGAYLTVMNGDPHMPVVALGQAYFAIQTRRQEITDELTLQDMPEDQKRMTLRSQMTVLNQRLTDAAQCAGVVKPEHFSSFFDHGYAGLYGGETENRIHARKHLAPNEKILDWMDSDELAANAFRASITRQRLAKDRVQDRATADDTHYRMGQIVRKSIIESGATLPEELPKPAKSIQQLRKEEQKRLEQKQQPPLFESDEE